MFTHIFQVCCVFCSVLAMFITVVPAYNFELVQPPYIFPSFTPTTENPRGWSVLPSLN